MADLELKKLKKVYDGNVVAVKGIDVSIKDQEFVVLVGPSGCGKTTCLRMIAGLEDISGGTLEIDNKVVNDIPPKDRDIAMVFQNYALYPHMSVYDNMAFGLKIRKMPKPEIEQRVREAAEILELDNLLHRKPKQLSGGQRQRVAVGRAIVRKPKVFLFDEPLSNLDAKLRVQMRTEISSLHNRLKATMIYVTHDQVEAMTMGDKIVVMKDGEVQQIGSPLTLYTKPANRFVAGFIGSPPMNFIDVSVESSGSKAVLKADKVKIELTGEWAKKIEKCGKKRLIFGVRPDNIHDAKDSKLPEHATGVIDIVEPLGSETHLYTKIGNHQLIAKVKPNTQYKSGDSVTLGVEVDHISLFDPDTEIAL